MAFLKKQNNIYHIVYKTDSGKYSSFTTKLTSKPKAQRLCDKFNAQRTLGLPFEIYSEAKKEIAPGKTLFSAAYEEFEAANDERAVDTLRSYRGAKNQWLKHEGDRWVSKYSEEDAKHFNKQYKNSGYSPNTLHSYTHQLSIMFNFFVEQKYIKSNPIIITKKANKEPEPVSQRNYDRIRRYYLLNGMIKQFDLISLLYLCAFRISEGIQAHREDFDVDSMVVHIRDINGDRFQKIVMLDDIKFFIVKLDYPPGRMFNYASRDSVKTVWLKAKQELGIVDKTTLHGLRKKRGTDLANQGAKPLFLQEFMRHDDWETTRTYYISVDQNKMRKDLNATLRNNDGIDDDALQ